MESGMQQKSQHGSGRDHAASRDLHLAVHFKRLLGVAMDRQSSGPPRLQPAIENIGLAVRGSGGEPGRPWVRLPDLQ